MRAASLGIARRASIIAGIASIFGSGASSAVEPVDLVLVASTAGQSSEIANRIVVNAYSEAGDTDSLQAFQQLGSETVTLLAEIEDESLAGTPLSGTRDEFIRVTQLVDHARHVVDQGHIHMDPVDEAELSQLLSVLDRQYSPPPPSQLPAP